VSRILEWFVLPSFHYSSLAISRSRLATMTSIDDQSTSDKKDSFSGEQICQVNSASIDQVTDEQRTLWQNVKKYRKVAWITLGLTSAILLYGYDEVVIGTISAMPVFQYVPNYLLTIQYQLTPIPEKTLASSTKANGSYPLHGLLSGTSPLPLAVWPARS
jgi:hypothetical protein